MADDETSSVHDSEPQDVDVAAEPSDNNIKIFLRIKPTKKASGFFSWEEDLNAMEYNIPKDVASGLINNSRTNYKFKFDGLIGMTAKQEEVFDRIGRPCVENALSGFNSTIFAYGQTGSGKTFTITGGAERYDDRGIIPRSISLIFETMKKRPECQITAYISYLEIYNNQGYDLLNEDHQNTKAIEDLPKVSMLEDEDGNCHLRNLSMHRVATEEDALNLLFLGDTNRAVSETSMNLESSRSHCIFTVSLESRRAGSEVILRSKLHMVDLAGSERAHKTGAKGKVLREAAYINTSLHYLEMVIVALHEKNTKGRTHIPYRNSMMTSVLRDSLGGNCKTVMVATASAEKEQTDESLSTCRFAQRVARVRNDAHLNEEVDPAIVIRRLKAQIVELQEEIVLLKGEPKEGDQLKDYEMDKLRQKCLDYANNRDPDAHLAMGEITYTKMKACFAFLKSFYLEGGGPSTTGPSSNPDAPRSGASNNQASHASDRVAELEETLQQRDNEIAILVQMLKKGGAGQPLEVLKSLEKPVAKPPPIPAPNQLTIKIDAGCLDDPAKAFEVFREQYPKNDVIRENKQLLKKKYDEAKALAQVVNDARGVIKEHMAAVEKVRKEKALQALAADDGAGVGVSAEETALVAQIDAKKAEYKAGFNTLNDLKKEIQHIQKLLEMSRIKLQKDFDLWYQSMGKGQLLTASLVHKASNPVVDDSPAVPSTAAISPLTAGKKPAPKPAWPPSPRTPSNQPKEVSPVPTTGIQDVDKDVSGFYEALDILKRRNSRK
ncbi:kinesin-like protein KIF6 [Achlya hypogyna]|uniref:Kinesin-like protein n=1 Tax=Achlya hypogyna TaxID=1202772 RepID=A0A1V9Z2U9_ACHHY|nr:kinesin-like protein KIF6 [Achlya hypogyna]